MGVGFYNPFGAKVNSMMKQHYSPEKLAFKEKVTNVEGLTVLTDLMHSTVMTTKAQSEAILNTLQAWYYIKAISGESNTDKDFDDFKAQWLHSGGQTEIGLFF